jgi:tRNA pseudouridine55 synthase
MSQFGILNVNKPPGWTSRDVVNRIERLTRPARGGHAGTLDPLASGVLVVCVGPATRLIQYVQRMRKRYRARFLLGRHSPTDDLEGEVTLLANASIPSGEMIEAALPRFLGEIQQRPPIYSAAKIRGRRAYKLARQGEVVELALRTITIYQLDVRRYEYPELDLDIDCGSGTYVRSLGRDLAAVLGTAAVMSALERTAVGGFRVEEAVPMDALSADTLFGHLQPPLAAVADLQRVGLSDEQLVEIRHGRPIPKPKCAARPANAVASPAGSEEEWAAFDSTGHLVAILREKRSGQLWPAINLGS